MSNVISFPRSARARARSVSTSTTPAATSRRLQPARPVLRDGRLIDHEAPRGLKPAAQKSKTPSERISIRSLHLLSVLSAAAILSGCSAAGPAWRSVGIDASESVVFVYRPAHLVGMPVPVYIEIDGANRRRLYNDGYVYQRIAPGRHTATAIGSNTIDMAFDALPGQAHYIRIELPLGPVGLVDAMVVPEFTGEFGVSRTRHSN